MKLAVRFLPLAVIVFLAAVSGCKEPVSSGPATLDEIMKAAAKDGSNVKAIEFIAKKPKEQIILANGEPAYITTQHCLIGFEGTNDDKVITRTQEEAEALANELFQKAKDGADFEAMIKENTDDSPIGIYQMANHGFPGDMSAESTSEKIFERKEMVPSFGDTAFPLKVGEYGLAVYDKKKCWWGWHIIKRVK